MTFPPKFKAVINQISKTEVPVGTVITSVLPPEHFLGNKNPQYDITKWIAADGRKLPSGSLYEQISGKIRAPDLTHLQQQRIVLDVISGAAHDGQTIRHLYTPKYADEDWVIHFGVRDVEGNKLNADFEQVSDQFQVIPDSGALKVQGRTHNYKQNKYGAWQTGSSNFLGIATKANGLFYYVKIN